MNPSAIVPPVRRLAGLAARTALVITSAAAAASAQEPEAPAVPELTRLQQAYQAKVVEQLRPLKEKYVEALAALEKQLAARGESDKAAAVRAERDIILRSEIHAPGFAPNDRERKVETTAEFVEFLVGTKWLMHVEGRPDQPVQTVTFGEAGKIELGDTKAEWRAVSERSVEVTHPDWQGRITLVFHVNLTSFSGSSTSDKMVRRGERLAR